MSEMDTMTEAAWQTATFARDFMDQACFKRNAFGPITHGGIPIYDYWRAVAARVACLEHLKHVLPEDVRKWISSASAYLDLEDRNMKANGLLYDSNYVYDAFRVAFDGAHPDDKQLLAAAQDAFRGCDYWSVEEEMLDTDMSSTTNTGSLYRTASAIHCNIIRDIFANPYRPVAIVPIWLSPDVVALAEAIYAERAFDRLPILADALEEAGCDHEEVLKHCRGPGPHVRGCWVVDLLLGKQ